MLIRKLYGFYPDSSFNPKRSGEKPPPPPNFCHHAINFGTTILGVGDIPQKKFNAGWRK